MKKINLIYWNSGNNFGDLLSPFIIRQISGLPIVYKELYNFKKIHLLDILHAIHHWDFEILKNKLLPWEGNILGVGSILKWGNKYSKIWGSGFLYETDSFNGGKIYALRGKFSNEIIINKGYKGCNIFGDPALLLPLIVPRTIKATKFLGIIPHFQDYELIKKRSKYDVINLKTSDIINKITEIHTYKYILSTSLHGLIVAHAYGIPAIWIKQNKIDGDNIKFKDYFSSTNIQFYDGFDNWESIIESESKVINFFNQNKNISLPQINILEIQKNLLSVAPFPLLSKYKSIID